MRAKTGIVFGIRPEATRNPGSGISRGPVHDSPTGKAERTGG
jgi:hypothetical protein